MKTEQKRQSDALRLTTGLLRQALTPEATATAATGTDPEAFWKAFRAHATLHPQYPAPAATAHSHPPRLIPLPLRWAMLAACSVAILIGAGRWHAALTAPLSRITAFEVDARHDAVLVMDDQKSHSTLLWIVGMEEPNGDRG